jgi:Tfp pilus assembly protein PilO
MIKIILSLILSTVAGIAIFGYVKPVYNDIKLIKAETAKYEKALKKASDIRALRESLLSQYSQFSDANRDKLKKLLPDDVDNVRLILDIDGIASARNIRIGSVKVQSNKKNSNTNVQTETSIGFTSVESDSQKYETLILQFSATAPYEQFKLFMQDLEHSLRIVDLVELNISQTSASSVSAGNTSDHSIYKFDVSIRTYWLK